MEISFLELYWIGPLWPSSMVRFALSKRLRRAAWRATWSLIQPSDSPGAASWTRHLGQALWLGISRRNLPLPLWKFAQGSITALVAS